MSKLIIDVPIFLFEGILLWYYANSAFHLKTKRSSAFFMSVVIHLALCSIYQNGNIMFNSVLFVLLYTVYFLTMYRIKIKTALFHSTLFCAMMIISEMVVIEIGTVIFSDFNAMEHDTIAYAYVVIASKLIYFVIMVLILRLAVKSKDYEKHGKYFWLLFFVPISSTAVLIAFRYITYNIAATPRTVVICIVSSLLLLFSNVVVFIIYEYSIKNASELYEFKTMTYQQEQDKRYYDVIEQSNNEMRIFAHDMKNHFIQLRNFDDINQVHNYIDSLGDNIEKFNSLGISKNKTLDLIIGKYSKLCEVNGISFSVNVKTSNLSYVDPLDLSTLLNNLLDNSLEAAKDSENAFIKLDIYSKNSAYDVIVLKNSCKQKPEQRDGRLITSKQNKELHGFGLRSIRKIVKKNGFLYNWSYDDATKIFETDIAVNKNDFSKQ